MPAEKFRVGITASAMADLFEMVEYWRARDEPWRGEKYFDDLTNLVETELSDGTKAWRGRRFASHRHPNAREVLAFGIYRIIYDIHEAEQKVDVLRFWHAHRDTLPLE